jgi:superfamily I DNA and RNA helicase
VALEVVHGQPGNVEAAHQLADLLDRELDEGTIYLGYPVLATADDRVEIDALLVSQTRGLIAFRFAGAAPPPTDGDWTHLSSEQDKIFNALESHLSRYDTLRQGRRFAIDIVTVTVFAAPVGNPPVPTEAVFRSFDELPTFVRQQQGLSAELYRSLQAALQRVSTIRPAKRRAEVKSADSRGAAMKVIERGIANLDFWQKKAAIETPSGPQRIRGLAGSGKTIVLALKAALLHAQNESWKIAVTFWSQSLYQQFEDLIKRFSFAHMDDLPDPEQVAIVHAWGTRSRQGLYTRLADALGVQPVNFGMAERKYGRDRAFEGVCQELLAVAQTRVIEPIFDAILVDEAQDLPPSFFRLLYLFTKDPKRIVWAYDELQKLDEREMASLAELFGTTATGDPVVNITNREGEPRRDVVLPVCYRNTPWALATAHSIGFGIYRPDGLVQHFEDPQLWEDIGYQRDAGRLQLGSYVELERSSLSSPAYFVDLLRSDAAVVFRSDFADEPSQDQWVARRQLARAMSDRPGVLAHGRSPAPRGVVDLLIALNRAGATGIAAPVCAECGKWLRTIQRRGEHWYCGVCGRRREPCAACGQLRRVSCRDRDGAPRCGQCPPDDGRDPTPLIVDVVAHADPTLSIEVIAAAAAKVAPQAGQRRRLAWALQDRPDLLTGAAAAPPVPTVLRLIEMLCDAGASAITRPACPGCGRVIRLHRPIGGKWLCRNCTAKSRAQPCARCGAIREAATRDEHGRPLCPGCRIVDPINQEVCVECDRRRPVSVRTEDGPRFARVAGHGR